jgi:hypothetical protein
MLPANHHLPNATTMRRISLLLALASLLLAASAAAQATTVQRLRGKDERGRYDVAWVRLADGVGEPAARARVNAELEREAREHICYPEADPERHKYLESWFEMEVTYLGPRLLGIRTRMDSWCGGASPSSGPGALLYDLRTGRRVELESEMADPPAFRRFVARCALAAAPEDAGECADNYDLEALTTTGYVYTLNDHGLTATQNYPRVIMACAHDTKIPYADIIRFAKPGSPLRTLGKR